MEGVFIEPKISQYVLDNPDDCIFIERTVIQSVDRAQLGYPDEWQFVVQKRPTGQEAELAYYAGTEDMDSNEFRIEYSHVVDQYVIPNPTIPRKCEGRWDREGIHYDQRLPVRKDGQGRRHVYSTVLARLAKPRCERFQTGSSKVIAVINRRRLEPKGTWPSSGASNSPDADVAPPAERRDLTYSDTHAERGKPVVLPW